jgi:transketolase
VTRRHGPTALILTRQNLPTLDRSLVDDAAELAKGAYVLSDFGEKVPDLILMASGSEVYLVYEAAARLAAEGLNVRAVSFPSWELFEEQDEAYRQAVLPKRITKRLAVEAGAGLGWERYAGSQGALITMERFGASAPGKILFEKFGFTIENVVEKAKELLETPRVE